MGTYTTLFWQSALLAVVGIALICFAPMEAKPWMGCLLAFALVFFITVSLMRHRKIRRLTAEIDEVLQSGRKVDLSDYRESDIALLSNELSKMIARLARTTELLEQERNALSDSLADISHQIRTPLTAASLMLPMIEGAEDTAERKRRTRELEMLIDRLSWLVTSLLKMAKFDAGAIHLEKAEINAANVVRSSLLPLEPLMDLRGIGLSLDLNEEAVFKGDAKWTAEAMENIIKNCIEHTPSGGRIEISVSEDAVATRICVKDTGSGIPPKDLPHIFERFYRGEGVDPTNDAFANEAMTNKAKGRDAIAGFGIGLSLAQTLLCAQGARIRAHNDNDHGAVFEMVFPKMTI